MKLTEDSVKGVETLASSRFIIDARLIYKRNGPLTECLLVSLFNDNSWILLILLLFNIFISININLNFLNFN